MDVLVLIDKLDDLVHNAKAVPLTDQVRIDREEIYDILDQMRATIPEEIKQARWIVKERQEMLAEAKREVDRLLAEARGQAGGGHRRPRASRSRRGGAAGGGRDGDAGVLRQEGGERAVVVRAEDHVELIGWKSRRRSRRLRADTTGASGAWGNSPGEEPVGLVGAAPADQGQLRDIAERRRSLEIGELGAGRDEQDIRILQQLGPLERPLSERQLGKCKV